MAFDLPGSMIGTPFIEETSVPHGYPRHEIKDPLRMRRPGYPGVGNENRGNPFLTAQGKMNPMTGQMDMMPQYEEDPGMSLDREQGKQKMSPPLTPPAFKSGAGGGFSGLERWLGKYGEHPSPYPNLATDPWLGR